MVGVNKSHLHETTEFNTFSFQQMLFQVWAMPESSKSYPHASRAPASPRLGVEVGFEVLTLGEVIP
jgi:hypothetical protein